MVNVDLNLVKNIIQVIDICSKRGAFEGGELSSVGRIRDDLIAAAKDELEAEAAAQQEAEDGTKQ